MTGSRENPKRVPSQRCNFGAWATQPDQSRFNLQPILLFSFLFASTLQKPKSAGPKCPRICPRSTDFLLYSQVARARQILPDATNNCCPLPLLFLSHSQSVHLFLSILIIPRLFYILRVRLHLVGSTVQTATAAAPSNRTRCSLRCCRVCRCAVLCDSVSVLQQGTIDRTANL